MANIYRDGFKAPSVFMSWKLMSYLVGYRQESAQVYHDAFNMNISINPKKEPNKIVSRGMFRGF